MVFYLIGLGLGDVDDITVRGLNIVRRCARVYLEAYTSVLCGGPSVDKLVRYVFVRMHTTLRFPSTVDRCCWPIAKWSNNTPTNC
jgi:diphthamide biosynthesis methyltransferase